MDVIHRFTTLVDPRNLGYKVAALILLEAELWASDGIAQQLASFGKLHHVFKYTGKYDIAVIALTKDLVELDRLVNEMKPLGDPEPVAKPTTMPLFVNLRGKRVVIFGGGKVGERRAARFAKHAGEVIVVSKSFTDGLKELAERSEDVHLRKQTITPDSVRGYVRDASVIVVATDNPSVDEMVGDIAHEYGKLVNRADGGPTDVVVPAILEKGNIQIAIRTGSPIVSRHLSDRIDQVISNEDASLLEVKLFARELAKWSFYRQDERRAFLQRVFLDDDIRQLVREGKVGEAKGLIRSWVGE